MSTRASLNHNASCGVHDGRACDCLQAAIDAGRITWPKPQAPVDPVRPRHYKDLSPEPIDVIAKWKLSFSLGCVVKYVARADLKGTPLVDLRKAAEYLAHEIAFREEASK